MSRAFATLAKGMAPSKLALVRAILATLLVASPARAADVQVAVAANFAGPVKRIAADFERDTGHHLVVATGATGAFFAQIEGGAPFEVLLAADRATPEHLEKDGFALAGSRFTYAAGTLVLWSPRAHALAAGPAALRGAEVQHVAIANPKLAPYGAAAIETLASLGLLDVVRARLVEGESIAQAYQFVASGNAEVGFVALSQVTDPGAPPRGSTWVVPASMHAPIAQDAVVLRKAAGNTAALAFAAYLKSAKAAAVMRSYGYEVPDARGAGAVRAARPER